MNLYESLKKTFTTQPHTIENPSSETDEIKVVRTLTDDPFEGAMVFGNLNGEATLNYGLTENTLLTYQSNLINMYRKLTLNPEVSNAVDIIINEMAFTVEEKEFKIDIDEENETIKKKINETFEGVLELLNISDNIHPLCRQAYIDGQLNVVLVYDEKNITDGVKKAYITEPQFLYFDKDKNYWKYDKQNQETCLYSTQEETDSNETFSADELIHIDFGLYDKVSYGEGQRGVTNLSYLENAFKSANMLDSLENMLVPMRYNRSVSRRMFNIDVADLPPKKAKQLMDNIRAEFKYKKTYDTTNGTIKNTQSTQNIVEDYWMSNRSGARGTTVETMDESGGLMDMEDIQHVAKKLYSSLKIPTNRNPYAEDDGGNFGYDAQDVTNEELQFYLFVDRLRIPIVKLIKQILERQIVSMGVMSAKEWTEYENKIQVQFTSRSMFLENMEKDLFLKSVGNYTEIKDEIGVIIPLEDAIGTIFGWSNTVLQERLDKVKGEINDRLYAPFYSSKEDDGF